MLDWRVRYWHPRWTFRRIHKISVVSSADHLGGACLAGFASNNAMEAAVPRRLYGRAP